MQLEVLLKDIYLNNKNILTKPLYLSGIIKDKLKGNYKDVKDAEDIVFILNSVNIFSILFEYEKEIAIKKLLNKNNCSLDYKRYKSLIEICIKVVYDDYQSKEPNIIKDIINNIKDNKINNLFNNKNVNNNTKVNIDIKSDCGDVNIIIDDIYNEIKVNGMKKMITNNVVSISSDINDLDIYLPSKLDMKINVETDCGDVKVINKSNSIKNLCVITDCGDITLYGKFIFPKLITDCGDIKIN